MPAVHEKESATEMEYEQQSCNLKIGSIMCFFLGHMYFVHHGVRLTLSFFRGFVDVKFEDHLDVFLGASEVSPASLCS